MKKKTLALLLAMVLIIGAAAGGTIAWLTDSSETVTNTFTIGDINIELDETTGEEYKMVPGTDLDKDPKVTVKAGSEACWLFVEITGSENLDDFISYTVASDWTKLDGTDNVYYIDQAALTADGAEDAVYSVLTDDQVSVKTDVTKTMLNALTEDTYPTLSFTAYAVQKGTATPDTAASAWTLAKPAPTP